MQDILKIFGDSENQFSEETKSQLTEALDSHIKETLEEKIQLALESQDTEHAEGIKLIHEHFNNQLLIEKDKWESERAIQIREAFDKIEEDRALKLKALQEKHEKELDVAVQERFESLVEGVDKHIDIWLENHVPTEMIEEAARKDYSEELLNKIGNIVGTGTIEEDVRSAVTDAKAKITTLEEENQSLKIKSFLAENTQNLPEAQVKFLLESFKGKDLDYIERNFSFLSEQFVNKGKQETLLEKQQVSKPVVTKQNVNQQNLLVEGQQQPKVDEEVVNPVMAAYVNSLKNSVGAYGNQ